MGQTRGVTDEDRRREQLAKLADLERRAEERGLSNNRTASGVSGPAQAKLPLPTVPMWVVAGQRVSKVCGGVGVGGDLGGGLFAKADVPAEAGAGAGGGRCRWPSGRTRSRRLWSERAAAPELQVQVLNGEGEDLLPPCPRARHLI
jgi:hypothetical protein